jgi:outer membrane receptor protein involved in Fe transport
VGAPSAAARDYVLGAGLERQKITLDAGGLTLRGEPLNLWAGPLSVAVGAEARRDAIRQDNGPLDAANALGLVNFLAFSGANTTREAFAETLVPLLADLPAARKLQFNGAYRWTDDRSGSIASWKLGFIDEVIEGLQVRAARSRDIRAPNLNELFTTVAGPAIINVSDPQAAATYFVRFFSGGNVNLKSEFSNTTTAGFTLRPSAIPSLALSVDYFDIDIDNAIGTISPQDIINLCQRGVGSACASIIRGSNGLIDTISASQINFTGFRTKGIDASVDYTLPVSLPGTLRVRSNLTRTTKFETNNGFATIDYVGSQGTTANNLGVPRLRVNTAVYYGTDRLELNVRSRYLSRGNYSNTLSIQNGVIPAYVYFDVGGVWRFSGDRASGLELYANIDNVLDKEPPIASGSTPYYDVIGRFMSIGARYRF